VSIFLSSFFPRLISAVRDCMSTILLHMVWPCWKYSMQKIAKKSPSGHHPTTLSGYIFATKTCIDNRKKLVKQQYLLHMSSQYGELRRTSGWDLLASLGHSCKFQRVSRHGSITARHSVVGASQTLRHWTEGATHIGQGGHHVGQWPTFLVCHWIAEGRKTTACMLAASALKNQQFTELKYFCIIVC